MDAKNKLMENLLKVAKKHKILTYPVLALVAIISFFGNLFSLRNGAGKRVVAIIMVMVMFVSQSYFLTSSATVLVDDEDTALIQKELQESSVVEEGSNSEKEDTEAAATEAASQETAASVDTATASEDETLNDTVGTPALEGDTETTTEGDVVYDADDEVYSKLDPDNADGTQTKKITYVLNCSDGGTTPSTPLICFYEAEVSSDATTYDLSGVLTGSSFTDAKASLEDNGKYSVNTNNWYYDKYLSKSESVSISSVTTTPTRTSGDVGYVDLYCKRELAQYTVTIANEKTDKNSTYFSSIVNYNPGSGYVSLGSSVVVDIKSDANGKYAELELSGLSRDGYSLDSVTTDSTGEVVIPDYANGHVKVRFSGSEENDSSSRRITLVWKPYKYTIRYYLDKNKSDYFDQPVEYDGGEYFISGTATGSEVVAPAGYKFGGAWETTGGISYPANEIIRGTTNPLFPGNGKTIELTPSFVYANIDLSQTEVHFVYKSEGPETTITASYKAGATPSGSSDNFTYEFADSGQKTTLENTYGIKVNLSANGGITLNTVAGGPKTTLTGNNAYELKIKITDSNAELADKDKIETQTIYIYIDQCQLNVKLADGVVTTKTYDGTDTPLFCSGSGTYTVLTEYASGDLKGQTADVTISCSMSNIAYNSANVVEANCIQFTFEKQDLKVSSGDSINNYVVVGTTVAGSITPKELKVIPSIADTLRVDSQGRRYVRAGEADPKFSFALKDASQLVGNDGLDTSWLNYIVGSTERTDLTTEGKYQITSFDTSKSTVGSNYELTCDIRDAANTSFWVIMESPVEGTNYTLDGIEGNNGWYYNRDNEEDKGIKITPTDDYDTVWISTDGGNTYTETEYLDEEYSNITNLYIKLTSEKDNGTGAVTKPVQLNLKYDGKAPQYTGYTVTMNKDEQDSKTYTTGDDIVSGGLYFPGVGGVMSFGTYANKTIQLKIKYEDTVSGVNKLYYGLYGAKPEQSVLFDKSTGYATIEVVAETLKQDKVDRTITCYAEDVAGNTSAQIKLSPNGNSDYEWSVESVAPNIERFVINGKLEETQTITVSDSREWYNSCEAVLSVGDAVSGLRAVTWHIVGDDDVTIPVTYGSSKIITSGTLTQEISQSVSASSDASYEVYAVIEDNAGNEVSTSEIKLKIDDEKPDLVVKYDDNVWRKDETISFTVSDALSGVDYVKVTDGDGNTINCDLGQPDSDGVYSASFDATTKGKYTIKVVDKAGNMDEWEQNITKISNQKPDCPTISFSPATPDGLEGWYCTVPKVTITASDATQDNTPVSTIYQMWQEGEKALNETTISGDKVERSIPGEGIYNVKAWSVSASGVECAASEEDEVQVKVDSLAPEISFDTAKGSGSSILINFTVTDSGSGVNPDTVKVLHGSQEMVAEVTEEDGTYTGSFEITETGSYTIMASDVAGNEAEAAAFTPMSMKVKAVTNISTNSATIGANVFKGTFDIASASIAYRKVSDDNFAEAQSVITKDDAGNAAVSAVLSGLTENTSYVFKITAVSEAPTGSSTGEVLEYVGYFKTLSTSSDGITVTGTARYSPTAEGTITVGIFEGNECIQATEVNAGDEFTFTGVPDGNYNIVATDGTYSKTMRLLIEDGVVVYPTKYIDLALSGKNTSVVITTSDTPNVTADDLDTIFELDSYNYTSADALLVDEGGTVEFKLYATLMAVTSVTSDEISAMYSVTDKNKVVGAYLDLSLYKVVTDAEGSVERTRVTELAKGANVSVTIPLGDLAGKSGLEVVRIHDTGDKFVGTSLPDADSNPSTYTISTTQFSTYAVLYDPSTTAASGDGSSTSSVAEGTANPSQSGTLYAQAGTSQQDPSADDDDDDSSTGGSSTSTSSGSSVGSLRSSGTAKTGDAMPIAMVGMVMMLSLSGFVFIRRKIK